MDDATTPVDRPLRRPEVRVPALIGRSEVVAEVLLPIHETVTAGRDAELELHLPYEGVSRRHARFEPTDAGEVTLRDLGSTNGTRVDGRAIDEHLLHGGERIELGPIELQFVRATAAELERLRSVTEARAALSRLSPREREVAQLVADGLRSGQIAERLHIGLRTVNTHLEHIYERLGVRSRLLLARLLHDALSSP